MIRRFCIWLSKFLPHITIRVPDPVTGELGNYLTRYYLFGKDYEWGNIFLHHFHDSDKGDELHNHPWSWSLGLILTGGYSEERRTPDGYVYRRDYEAGCLNLISDRDFHRVDLLEKDAWTLFLAGRRTQEWGFWDRHTRSFRDWKTNPNAIP
jgi:hypothetical protein